MVVNSLPGKEMYDATCKTDAFVTGTLCPAVAGEIRQGGSIASIVCRLLSDPDRPRRAVLLVFAAGSPARRPCPVWPSSPSRAGEIQADQAFGAKSGSLILLCVPFVDRCGDPARPIRWAVFFTAASWSAITYMDQIPRPHHRIPACWCDDYDLGD